jgi:ankyrin repeat protein
MASTSAATTEQQANLDITEEAKSDDDAKGPAATSIATTNHEENLHIVQVERSDDDAKAATNQQANLDFLEAAKKKKGDDDDDDAKGPAATSVATTNHEENLHIVQVEKSDDDAKATTNQQANLDLLEAAKKKKGDDDDGEKAAVAALAQQGVDVNCRQELFYRFTPLILTIESNNVKVARVLLADPRVDVNAADTSGLTALHRSRNELLQAIIDSKRMDIKWNVVDEVGRTPLLNLARMTCREDMKKLSKIESVNLLARSIDQFTALHEQAEQESPFPTWFKKASEETRCKFVAELFKLLETRHQDLVTFVNATDILDRSALHYIAEEGSVKMLTMLLEKCSTPSLSVDCHGFTPLHLAVRRGHTRVVKLLLNVQGMDANVAATVNARNPSGLQPWESIHLALCRPDLFSKAPKEIPTAANLTPLHFAAMEGHTEIVDLLLKWPGIHVAPLDLDTKGLSPFHYSIQNGHSGVVKLLLEKLENVGQPFNFCNEWLALLDHSIQKDHLAVVKLLVAKAKPFELHNYEEQMSMFENLLHVATEHNKKEIAVELLDTLASKAEPLAQTSTQSSNHHSKLLAIAARENYFKIIRYVLSLYPEVDANASIELVAHQDLVASPLHYAALGGHVEAVKELLTHHNLDVNTKDNKNRTPLLCAIKGDNLGVVKALCFGDPGNRIRATEEYTDSQTPVQIATEANMKEIEKVLLERPEVKDFVDRLYRDRQPCRTSKMSSLEDESNQ